MPILSIDPVRRRSSLLCDLGRHKAGSLAHWNDGYYFSKCRRCGRDLVRTAFGRWTVPRGYRVVWTAEPPPRAKAAQLIRAGAAVGDARAVDASRAEAIEFPIREPADTAAPEPKVEVESATPDAADDRIAGIEVGSVPSPPADIAAPAEDEPDGGDDAQPLAVSDIAQESSGFPPIPPQSIPAAALAVVDEDQPADRHDDEGPETHLALGEGQASMQVDEPEIAFEPEAPARITESAPPPIPDFMDGGSFDVPYDLSTGAPLRPASANRDGAARLQASPDDDGFDAFDGPGGRMRRMTDSARASMDRRSRADRRSAVAARSGSLRVDPRRHRPTFIERQGGIIAAALFGGLVLAAALIDNHGSDAARNLYRPIAVVQAPVPPAPVIAPVNPVVTPDEPVAAAAEPVVEAAEPVVEQASPATPPAPSPVVSASAPGDDRAYVTASLLNCRAVPNDDAATVRRLQRGATVQVLGVDPGWINISHGGQRCWAAAEHISAVRPV